MSSQDQLFFNLPVTDKISTALCTSKCFLSTSKCFKSVLANASYQHKQILHSSTCKYFITALARANGTIQVVGLFTMSQKTLSIPKCHNFSPDYLCFPNVWLKWKNTNQPSSTEKKPAYVTKSRNCHWKMLLIPTCSFYFLPQGVSRVFLST